MDEEEVKRQAHPSPGLPPQDHTEKGFHLCCKNPPFEAYTPNQLSDGEASVLLIPQLPKKTQSCSPGSILGLSPNPFPTEEFPCTHPVRPSAQSTLELLCLQSKRKVQEGGLWASPWGWHPGTEQDIFLNWPAQHLHSYSES